MPRRDEPPLSPELILRLQKTAGNRAVQRVLAARTRGAARAPATVLPPAPPSEELPAPTTVEVITVVPARERHGWLFVVVSLFVTAFGWTGSRLRLKGKVEDE
jgi:hypothetical protein